MRHPSARPLHNKARLPPPSDGIAVHKHRTESRNSPGNESGRIDLTQENIAEILTVTRVNAARNLGRLRDERIIVPHRRWIEIIDQQALEDYCSEETLQA